jgi:hypothetical protein
MKKLLIKKCPDSMRWYKDSIGELVDYLGDVGNEYKSREPAGYINFVQYTDAEIVEIGIDIGLGSDYTIISNKTPIN